MQLLTRCDHCRSTVFAKNEKFRCPDCKGIYCSKACFEEHDCTFLPKLHLAVEDNITDNPDFDFDIVSILKTVARYGQTEFLE